jgi:hypothetical protein
MARADEYRRYAAECVRVAQQTEKESDRLLLLQMAEVWQRLADRAAKGSSPAAPVGKDEAKE